MALDGPAGVATQESTDFQWKLLYYLWLLRLFRPEWVLAYYVPALGFFRTTPTLLLVALTYYWFTSSKKKFAGMHWLAVYCIFTFATAPFAESLGPVKNVARFTFEQCLLGVATLTFADTPERTRSLLKLFLVQFIYIAIWGILGRGLVSWDNVLNEEDAFGPYMCIGVAFAGYYESACTGKERRLALIALGLCVIGVVASFARGAFLSMVLLLIYRTVVSTKIVRNVALAIGAAIAIYFSSQLLFPPAPGESGDPFWTEMATIADGTSKGTGRDRAVLWSVAWEEFKDNPIIGVGAHNFGVVAPRYVGLVKDRGDFYADPATIWGRALHNGYFQILSEGGMVGVLICLAIVLQFLWLNIGYGRFRVPPDQSGIAGNLPNFATALRYAVIAYLMNLDFYDITYYNWFWDLVLVNLVVSSRVLEAVPGMVAARVTQPSETGRLRVTPPARVRAPLVSAQRQESMR